MHNWLLHLLVLLIRGVEAVDVCLVVLGVVQLHDLRAYDRLQGTAHMHGCQMRDTVCGSTRTRQQMGYLGADDTSEAHSSCSESEDLMLDLA